MVNVKLKNVYSLVLIITNTFIIFVYNKVSECKNEIVSIIQHGDAENMSQNIGTVRRPSSLMNWVNISVKLMGKINETIRVEKMKKIYTTLVRNTVAPVAD